MCFNQGMSFAFAGVGLFVAYYVKTTGNTRLAIGVFFFFLMEFLQGFQYFFIDDCSSWWNQFLTLLGFAHICAQPFFTHVMNASLTSSRQLLAQYAMILKLCILGGTMLFGRWVISNSSPLQLTNECPSAEWLRGDVLCTYSGVKHLAWSVPMYEPTYWVPGVAIHSFLMFAPFVTFGRLTMFIQGLVLWASGPFLAHLISPNLQEQASIWCFFSIMQITCMVMLIRRAVPTAESEPKWKLVGWFNPKVVKDNEDGSRTYLSGVVRHADGSKSRVDAFSASSK